ncbi:MAG: hypothetical protein MJZ98_00130 [Paludibacteraceae bacterium]|nr:hypothetical protein [Paludibacteraceae bacterium]
MIDPEKLKVAKEWVEKLANGINPLTNGPVKDDDVVNNVHISRCLFYVAEMMGSIQENGLRNSRRRAFSMTAAEAEQIPVNGPLGISMVVKAINDRLPEDMRTLTIAQVLKWLRSEEYMQEVVLDEKHKSNYPTAKGNVLGITLEITQNADGFEYKRVYYNETAQRFIYSNIENIAAFK